ncbi:MAG: dihydrodipicolinate synthase family protein [Gemmatimonadota bacterium]
MNLAGIYLPVTTPFAADGTLDLDGFASNLARWAQAPIAGFLVGGSTGEAVLLEDEELAGLIRRARLDCAPGLTLIAGTGAESTARTLSLCALAAAEGADAVLVRPPSYFASAMSDLALREHFVRVADTSELPVLLYHVPKYVPVALGSGLVEELAQHDNIIGIKDSSGDLKNLAELVQACSARAHVLVGSGSQLYSGLETGAAGGIVAVGLLAAAACCDLESAWRADRGLEAGRIQERIGRLNKDVVGRFGVPGIKYALDVLGWRGGDPRMPLQPLGSRDQAAVLRALERAGLTP